MLSTTADHFAAPRPHSCGVLGPAPHRLDASSSRSPTLVTHMSHPSVPASSLSVVDASRTVDEVLLAHPESAAVFNAFGVDTCCGGSASLGEAALHAHLTPRALLHALERSLDGSPVRRDGGVA
jgi:regulator of cell morphogenesis and NO signaling